MNNLQARFDYFYAQLDKELGKYPLAVKVEQRANVPKPYIAAGVFGFICTLLFFNYWGQLLSNLVAFLYPAYMSFKAVETPTKDDDTQWLTYWTVYAFISIIEFFSDIILYWAPFYYLCKTAFFLWLALPPFRGAEKIYQGFLGPYLRSHQTEIDSGLSRIKSQADRAVNNVLHGAVDAASALKASSSE